MFCFSPIPATNNFGGLLGQPFGSQVPYKSVLGAEEQQRYNGTLRRVKLRWFPITFMDQYSNKSFEELRFEDYSIGRKSSLNGIPKKEDDLTVAMANFTPQTYTNVNDIKMMDTGKSAFGGSFNNPFGSLNNYCFGTTGNNNTMPTSLNFSSGASSNLFGLSSISLPIATANANIFGNTTPTNIFNATPPPLSAATAPIFNFQNTFGNSQTSSPSNSTTMADSKPLFSFSNNNVDSPAPVTTSSPFSQSSTPSPISSIFGPQTTSLNTNSIFQQTPSNQCIPMNNTQVGTPFHIPTYVGPKLYPIFNGPNLVGYTMNDIVFNPSIKTDKEDTTSRVVDDEVASAWKEFYEYCHTRQLKLFPTSKPGEFLLDTDPKIRFQGRCTFQAYDKLWNNADYQHLPKNSEDKIFSSSNPYWKQLDLKQLATPYTDAKFAEKRRRSLLTTEKIFPSLAHQQQNCATAKVQQNNLTCSSFKQQEVKKLNLSSSTTKVNRKVNHFRQQQQENQQQHQPLKVEKNYSEPLQQPQTDSLDDDKKLNGLRPPVPSALHSFIIDNMSGGEAAALNIKEKESEEAEDGNINNNFKIIGTDAENVRIIDRSRRPRSKSLSVRLGGKSCGVHLTRDRYYCIPSIQTMDTMVDEYGRCVVDNFEIGHMDFGHMIFDGKMDVAGVNLDEIVVFNLKEMFLYPATDQDCDLPLCLQKLNQPAMVTLLQVWPQRHGTNEFIRDLNAIKSINYEFLLRKTCERMGVTFVSYDPVKGHWLFRIQDNMVHWKSE